jgi:hypothetical protein
VIYTPSLFIILLCRDRLMYGIIAIHKTFEEIVYNELKASCP